MLFMFSRLRLMSAVLLLILAAISNAASLSAVTICSSTQCLQGTTSFQLGATLSSPSISSSILLVPDTYSSSSSLPSVLLSALQSPLTTVTLPSSSLLNASSGVSASVSLPLEIFQSAPLLAFPDANFTGTGVSFGLAAVNSTYTTTTINTGSLMLVDGLWAVLVQNSSSTRIVVWQSVPDFSQVSGSSAFDSSSPVSLVSLQSMACNTPCSSSGTCTASGACNCPPQFSGASCETCAEKFFGPSCQPCPPNCLTCDDGPAGTGKCLSTTASNLPSSCNCLNGVCSSSGTCSCNNGWATSPGNSTACSSCANGFFDNGDGECRACALNCLSCTAGSGTCTACDSGFIQDSSTPSQCIVSSGASCPDGQFNNGGTCTACSNLCTTCSGPLSTNCIICGPGLSSLAGQCVPVNANGVCSLPNANTRNSTFIVNNAKNECDTCPSTCTSCQIPAFSISSLISQAQCTACLPGYVLSGGKCLQKCPAGTFVDPNGDGLSCVACDPSCGSCAGSKTFCLTCWQSSKFALSGQCVSSCPSSTFASSGACVSCHPDCATCSASGFDKCTSCSRERPVLSSSGRCLLACGKSQYFDTTSGGTGSCQSCDSSCATCTSSGPSSCLTCPSGKVLKASSCVDALCTGGTSGIVASLGDVCLSSLVQVIPGVPVVPSGGNGHGTQVPSASGVSAGLPTSTAKSTAEPVAKTALIWWQIMIIVVGGAALLILGLVLWRQHARRARQNETLAFKSQRLERTEGWRGWFGFGSSGRRKHGDSASAPERIREAEAWRYEMDRMEDGLSRRRASVLHSPISDRFGSNIRSRRVPSMISTSSTFTSPTSARDRLSPGGSSTYSQSGSQNGQLPRFGNPKRDSPPLPFPDLNRSNNIGVPQPRQPIKDSSTARYSNAFASSTNPLVNLAPNQTGASTSSGATAVHPGLSNVQPLVDVPVMSSGEGTGTPYWIASVDHMPSTSPPSRNPFRHF